MSLVLYATQSSEWNLPQFSFPSYIYPPLIQLTSPIYLFLINLASLIFFFPFYILTIYSSLNTQPQHYH